MRHILLVGDGELADSARAIAAVTSNELENIAVVMAEPMSACWSVTAR